ncbi:hypothetical protein BN946_scf184940.g80 [Trametes cinnabarina]|uniref:Hydrophobin n=1 Tax=Pycnoporus cinnabarinus TaxID=5643 RepID=A0A060SHN4_PYCCI|nr:hypothetical protein BN946_scf184940.g80 [Trametes cinnabarina]
MFPRLAAIVLLALPALVVAQDCATGPIQCCNQVQPATSTAVAPLLAAIGVAVQDVTAQVGLGCTPVSVIGVASGGQCDAHPVCCENNSFGSLISIGCVPVEL